MKTPVELARVQSESEKEKLLVSRAQQDEERERDLTLSVRVRPSDHNLARERSWDARRFSRDGSSARGKDVLYDVQICVESGV